MNEKKLIGSILAEENDSDEEFHQKLLKPKRFVLLNEEELQGLERSSSLPTSDLAFPQGVWPSSEPSSPSKLNITAPEFVPSSPIKSAFKSNEGKIVGLSLDQQGSRYIQQIYNSLGVPDKQLIFEEVLPALFTLVFDIFGNYVVQKILEFGLRDHKRAIIARLLGHVVEFSVHMYGCRVLQKVFEFGEVEQKVLLAHELETEVARCIEDQNGNHVIQKCLEFLSFQHVQFVRDIVKEDPVKWAVHPYGCRVLQKVIECTPRDLIAPILKTLVGNAVYISQEPYGNYVVQYILDKGHAQDKHQTIRAFLGELHKLSKHKFASNVIEKCLVMGTPEQATAYSAELFEPAQLFELMTDKFANFVVQKTIEVAQGEAQCELIVRVLQHADALKNYTQGKYVLNFIEKLRKGGDI